MGVKIKIEENPRIGKQIVEELITTKEDIPDSLEKIEGVSIVTHKKFRWGDYVFVTDIVPMGNKKWLFQYWTPADLDDYCVCCRYTGKIKACDECAKWTEEGCRYDDDPSELLRSEAEVIDAIRKVVDNNVTVIICYSNPLSFRFGRR